MARAPHHIHTPDFIRAATLRALGARLVDVGRDGDKRYVVLDVADMADTLRQSAIAIARELEAIAEMESPAAIADALASNTLLGTIAGYHSDLKRRA